MAQLIKPITPHLWFTTPEQVKEAVEYYVSVFPNSKILSSYVLHNTPTPGGDTWVYEFELNGQRFMAINGGDIFKFNEAVSFIITCETQEELDAYWSKLSVIQESDLPAPRPGQFFVYVILCEDDSMYIGQTDDLKKRWNEHRTGKGAEHTKRHPPLQIIHFEDFNSREEAVKREHDLKTGFGRKWIKREWKAGRTRQAGQCGWCKDKFGVVWQITPLYLDEVMSSGDQAKIDRVTQCFLPMKKIVIADLKRAAE